MTKEELLQVINEKIEGQYNQLDLSNVVPAILRDLVGASIGVEVEDITDIDGAVLDALSCGDNGTLAGTETVSYDYTEDGWAYNSTDKGAFA